MTVSLVGSYFCLDVKMVMFLLSCEYGKYGCDDGMTDVMSDVFEYPGMKIDTVIIGSRKRLGSGQDDTRMTVLAHCLPGPCKLPTQSSKVVPVYFFAE